MKGAGKIYGSLSTPAKPSIQRVKNTKKKSLTRNRLLQKYGLKRKFRTLKKKLKEEDTSDIGVLKSFIRANRFIELFIKKYDTVMKSNNEDKRSNYSLFATMLASNILSVVKQYERIVDDDDLHLNNNAEELLINPNEFLEDFIEFVEEDKTADEFANIAIKYFKASRPNRMEANNQDFEDLEEDYKEYQGFLQDTVTAVKDTIKEYSLDEKIKDKMAININSLVMGMSAMKVKGASNTITNITNKVVEKNNKLNEDFYSMFNKLGL